MLDLKIKIVLVILLACLVASPFYLVYATNTPPRVPLGIHEAVFEDELGYASEVGGTYHWRMIVSSTEAFEIKAINFQLDDPEVQIDHIVFSRLELNENGGSGSAAFKINILNTYFSYIPSNYGGHMSVELLSYMVNVYPAGASGDSVILYFYAYPEDDLEGIDGDQSVYVKAIVESAHQATVSVTILPDWP